MMSKEPSKFHYFRLFYECHPSVCNVEFGTAGLGPNSQTLS